MTRIRILLQIVVNSIRERITVNAESERELPSATKSCDSSSEENTRYSHISRQLKICHNIQRAVSSISNFIQVLINEFFLFSLHSFFELPWFSNLCFFCLHSRSPIKMQIILILASFLIAEFLLRSLPRHTPKKRKRKQKTFRLLICRFSVSPGGSRVYDRTVLLLNQDLRSAREEGRSGPVTIV